jgi:hypothetical protein
MARGDTGTASRFLEKPPRYVEDPQTNFQSIADWQIKFFQNVRTILDSFEARLAEIEGEQPDARLTRLEDLFDEIHALGQLSGSTDTERQTRINEIVDLHELPDLPDQDSEEGS